MRHSIIAVSFFVLLLLSNQTVAQTAVSITIDGSINPASADFIHRAVEKGKDLNAACLIVLLNTPGGLLESTRSIVSDFLASPIPVIVYVSPAGAHAGSAGVFVTLAADVAAMAPGTNIGAAHPVMLQGQPDSIMNEKSTNDAAAFIRTIAEKRNRNLQWAEEAVRKSLAITETEALNKNVIDLIAKDDRELLEKVDGRAVVTQSGVDTLHTRGARIEQFEMGVADDILNLLSDPNIVYILFMLGVYGLLFELYNPGSIFPGVIGVISLILAFYAMHTLPINYAGLGLILFAIVLFIAEIKIVSHGLLAIGGVVSLLLGSMMLFRSESALEFVQISWSVIITSVLVTFLFFTFIIGVGLRALRSKPSTGSEGLVGEIGDTLTALNPEGRIRVHGEIWNATSVSGKISKDVKVRVVGVDNLTLRVELASN